MQGSLTIRQAAVLGAGVMGAQIAAHLSNAGIPVLLFDLAAPQGDPNAEVLKALAGLRKLEPPPLATTAALEHIEAVNYAQHLARLSECDLVIEAIAERMDWKVALYQRIGAQLAPGAIVASNTSGLSITALGQALPAAFRSRFCGVHFFNPPRYMALVELIATPDTDSALLDALETWLTSRLGKNVVRAPDTPNFIANRIGIFSMLAAMHHTVRLGLGFDEVDALTGPAIGRPKSATYRTADVVGLDTVAHVVQTMHDTLPDDPWHRHFQTPDWLSALIAHGALGQKTRAGVYRKQGKDLQVLDPASGTYRPVGGTVAPEIADVLKLRDPAQRFAALRASHHPQAQFLWSIFRDTFHYAAVHLEQIADNARDLDFAMRWGFGWSEGPFETWQAAGWQNVAAALSADIVAGQAMSNTPLPAWASEPSRSGVHAPQGSFSPGSGDYRPRTALPVYRRQLYPEQVLGETAPEAGQTLWENSGVRLWRLPKQDAGIAILSFHSKMHAIGEEVLEGVLESITRAERDFDALVLWHEPPFAVGANLKQVAEACEAGQFERLDATIAKFQRSAMALKYAQVPVVAAVQGMALGGGCEFVMHAARRVMAFESYIGLVEAGVGLIPAGGGCKEFALRAARLASTTASSDEVFPFLQNVFQTLAMAKVSKSAREAQEYGFVPSGEPVLLNARELLFVALREARAMADAGYVAPLPARKVTVAGRDGIATLEMMLVNMHEGGMISAHDYRVARAAAVALCGGEIDPGTQVDEYWLLEVERREFVALLRTPETQARIRHMLDTGKPLRN